MRYFIAGQDGSSIIVAFDVCEGETHIETSVVSVHPVEDGVGVTDHIRPEPSLLSLVLGVTQTPIEPDPGQGRGGPLIVDLDTPHFDPPFDGSPGAIFRAAGGLFSGPSTPTTTVEVLGFPEPFDRIREVEQQLLELKTTRELCTVITQSRDYRDMALVRAELVRSGPGYALFSCDFQQVRVVRTASVNAPKPQEPRGAPKVSKGQQTPVEANSALKKAFQELQNNSILLKLVQ